MHGVLGFWGFEGEKQGDWPHVTCNGVDDNDDDDEDVDHDDDDGDDDVSSTSFSNLANATSRILISLSCHD